MNEPTIVSRGVIWTGNAPFDKPVETVTLVAADYEAMASDSKHESQAAASFDKWWASTATLLHDGLDGLRKESHRAAWNAALESQAAKDAAEPVAWTPFHWKHGFDWNQTVESEDERDRFQKAVAPGWIFEPIYTSPPPAVPDNVPDRVSIHAMYDCHLFKPIFGSTVDEVIENWLRHNKEPHPCQLENGVEFDMGPADLCPAIVLKGNKEIRRVGQMVHIDWRTKQPSDDAIRAYRNALKADPDIARLLAAAPKVKP